MASKSLDGRASRLFKESFMPRWIAFDQKTVERLRERLPRAQVFEHGARNVADYVTGGPETLVTVLPLDSGNEAAVAVFRQRGAHQKTAAAQSASPRARAASSQPQSGTGKTPAAQVRPGGFLGLRDEVFEEEQRPRQKKTWWQRFWDEDE